MRSQNKNFLPIWEVKMTVGAVTKQEMNKTVKNGLSYGEQYNISFGILIYTRKIYLLIQEIQILT